MGWTFPYSPPADPQAELDSFCTWDGDSGRRSVLKSSMVGSTYYAAVEHLTPDGQRIVWAAVILTQRDKGEWGYKEMDETMGPYYFDCPVGILNLLTPTDSESAMQWREKCRAKHAAKKSRPEPKAGARVKSGGSVYRLDQPAGPRKGWIVSREGDGRLFRMPAAQLSRAEFLH